MGSLVGDNAGEIIGCELRLLVGVPRGACGIYGVHNVTVTDGCIMVWLFQSTLRLKRREMVFVT